MAFKEGMEACPAVLQERRGELFSPAAHVTCSVFAFVRL